MSGDGRERGPQRIWPPRPLPGRVRDALAGALVLSILIVAAPLVVVAGVVTAGTLALGPGYTVERIRGWRLWRWIPWLRHRTGQRRRLALAILGLAVPLPGLITAVWAGVLASPEFDKLPVVPPTSPSHLLPAGAGLPPPRLPPLTSLPVTSVPVSVKAQPCVRVGTSEVLIIISAPGAAFDIFVRSASGKQIGGTRAGRLDGWGRFEDRWVVQAQTDVGTATYAATVQSSARYGTQSGTFDVVAAPARCS